jgi:hypothetical protein
MKSKSITGSLFVLSFIISITSCIQKGEDLVAINPVSAISNSGIMREALSGDTVIVGVAKINNLPDGSTEYLFNERQARYTVDASRPDAAVIRRLAEAALESKRPLRLISASPGTITKLETPSAAETNI